jgi:hypothetical protein
MTVPHTADLVPPRGRVDRLATGRGALAAVAAAVAFAAAFRVVLARLRVQPIELEWWPRDSGPDLLATIAGLQAWERTNHLWALAVDFAFPFFYGLGLALPALYLLRRAGAGPGVRRLGYAAIAAAACDLAENACIAALLLGSTFNAVAWAVIVFSAAKWMLLATAGVVLVLAALTAGVKWLGRRVWRSGASAA